MAAPKRSQQYRQEGAVAASEELCDDIVGVMSGGRSALLRKESFKVSPVAV
jgi:hypothetical protein